MVEVDYIVIVTKNGMVLKWKAKQIRGMHRGCKGVKAIDLREGDSIVSAFSICEIEGEGDQ